MRRLMPLLTLFSCCFFSCSNNSTDEINTPGKVYLKAVLADAKSTKIGDSWMGTEHVGVYMTEAANFIEVDEVANRKFSVSAGSGGVLQPVEGEMPYYPSDGTDVKFTAYYPYRADIANNIYPIDLADATVPDHDLLYASTTESYNQQYTDAVSLIFTHQLSKLILKLKIEEGNSKGETTVFAPKAEWSASIVRSTKAQFDLATGQFGNLSDSRALPMMQTEAAAESLILPGQEGKVMITYDGRSYEWKTAGNKFDAGVQYTYTITLKTQAADPVEVKLESTIKEWEKVDGEVVLEEDNTSANLPEDEASYESNLNLPSFQLDASTYHAFVSISDKKYDAIKMGSSSKVGSCKSGVINKSGKQLAFYAIGWNGMAGALKISLNNGGKIDGKASVTIYPKGNAGATGSGTTNATYTVSVTNADYYQFALTELTDNSTLTFETVSGANDPRAILFGVNVK